eukprot:6792-Pelagomonas_calceolata.AAC.1
MANCTACRNCTTSVKAMPRMSSSAWAITPTASKRKRWQVPTKLWPSVPSRETGVHLCMHPTPMHMLSTPVYVGMLPTPLYAGMLPTPVYTGMLSTPVDAGLLPNPVHASMLFTPVYASMLQPHPNPF